MENTHENRLRVCTLPFNKNLPCRASWQHVAVVLTFGRQTSMIQQQTSTQTSYGLREFTSWSRISFRLQWVTHTSLNKYRDSKTCNILTRLNFSSHHIWICAPFAIPNLPIFLLFPIIRNFSLYLSTYLPTHPCSTSSPMTHTQTHTQTHTHTHTHTHTQCHQTSLLFFFFLPW